MTLEDITHQKQIIESLINRASRLFMRGDHETAKETINQLIVQTITFPELSRVVGLSVSKLLRLLSSDGNPTMKDIGMIVTAIWKNLDPKGHARETIAASREVDYTVILRLQNDSEYAQSVVQQATKQFLEGNKKEACYGFSDVVLALGA